MPGILFTVYLGEALKASFNKKPTCKLKNADVGNQFVLKVKVYYCFKNIGQVFKDTSKIATKATFCCIGFLLAGLIVFVFSADHMIYLTCVYFVSLKHTTKAANGRYTGCHDKMCTKHLS